MPHAWHSLGVGPEHGDSLEAHAAAPAGSPWFDGHFPGRPILPGIAMISMAFDAALQQEARAGRHLRLKAVTRVRFKKPVRPGEQVTLLLKREQREADTLYRFTVLVGGEAGCTGVLHTEPLAA